MKNNIKWFLIGVLVPVCIIGIAILTANRGTKITNSMDMMAAPESVGYIKNGNYDNINIDGANILGDKVIYSARISLKTDNYAQNIQNIKDTITNFNAGIASFNENANNRYDNNKQYMYADIVVKVPQEKFRSFVEQIKQSGMYVSTYNEATQDITEAYMDVESKLVSLKQQEAILNELLTKAQNVGEIIEINNQKQQVIQQIEYNTKIQQTYDNKIAYSTVTINIQEVDSTQVTEKGIGQRLGDTIVSGIDGLKFLATNLLLLIVYLLPFALVIGVIVLIIVVIVKKTHKNKKQ